MEKLFGNTQEVFINQDEGMFSAFPVTFDELVLDLEIEDRAGRRFVTAGSVVKKTEGQDTFVLGITAEEYEITEGAVVGRVVVEGYAWETRLTPAAIAAAELLPKITLYPVKIKE